MRDHLGAVGEGPCDPVGIDAVLLQPGLVKDYHIGEIAAGGMAPDKNLVGTAAAGRHLAEGPRDCRGGIVDGLLDGGLGQEPVVHPYNPEAGIHQGLGDLLIPPDEAASVEPHDGRKVLQLRRIIEVQSTALPGIIPGILMVRDVLLDLVLSAVRALGKGDGCQKEAANSQNRPFHI